VLGVAVQRERLVSEWRVEKVFRWESSIFIDFVSCAGLIQHLLPSQF
jgi:hypothetical protein